MSKTKKDSLEKQQKELNRKADKLVEYVKPEIDEIEYHELHKDDYYTEREYNNGSYDNGTYDQ